MGASENARKQRRIGRVSAVRLTRPRHIDDI
jgi:hypothetical protein